MHGRGIIRQRRDPRDQVRGQGLRDRGGETGDEDPVHAAQHAGDRSAVSVPLLQYLAAGDPAGGERGGGFEEAGYPSV